MNPLQDSSFCTRVLMKFCGRIKAMIYGKLGANAELPISPGASLGDHTEICCLPAEDGPTVDLYNLTGYV